MEEAGGKDLGANYFLVLQYEYNMFGNDIACYQAVTVNESNSNMFIFTFATMPDIYDSAKPVFETMLSTLVFQ